MKKALISMFIVTCLGLQAWVVFNPPRGMRGALFWPFTDYPMYRRAFYKGQMIKLYTIYGLTAESEMIKVEPSHMGLNYWTFLRGPIHALSNNRGEKVRFYADLYESKQQKDLIGLRLVEHSWELQKEGPKPRPDQIVREVAL